jgi:hypothetical protein
MVISQTAVESVVRDIQAGNTDYVDEFFASRPDWQDDGASQQTDNQPEEKQEEVAQA